MDVRPLIRGGLRTAGVELRRPPRALLGGPVLDVSIEHLISRLVVEREHVFFVQIGAFDGRTNDLIYPNAIKYEWHGIAVEPQPKHFAELQRAYADSEGVALRNVAVADKPGTRALWSISERMPDRPQWASQMATFDRDRLVKAGFGDYLISSDVQCVTVSELLSEIDRVDLLQIDVEGYDAEVIRMFDFATYQPTVVRFENWCLSRADHNAAVRRLIAYGYQVAAGPVDTLGWHD